MAPIPPPGGGTIELFRENTQGLYSGVGGTVSRGAVAQVAIDESVYTRDTVERFTRFTRCSLGRLSELGCRRAVLVHKANAVPHTGSLPGPSLEPYGVPRTGAPARHRPRRGDPLRRRHPPTRAGPGPRPGSWPPC